MQLTNEELDQFHTLGYVVKPAVFTQSDMQPIKAAIDETVDAKARQLYAAGQLADLCADMPFETRLAAIQAVDAAAAQAIVQHLWGKGGGGYSGPAMLAPYILTGLYCFPDRARYCRLFGLSHSPQDATVDARRGALASGFGLFFAALRYPSDRHVLGAAGRCRSGKWLSVGFAKVASDRHPDPPSGWAWRLSGNCEPRPAPDRAATAAHERRQCALYDQFDAARLL